ncbi:MAG: poly-gamma-glutamate biosynthesis protein PgsC [candidate division KSB1 bacterium]|nr:poly-gamma-glutamate biosynthesis protein PgsC [candidate division KSB1 bacterium]MDZ7336403.1 poly-gamma-glutamate biosynthesis protein PgsC [candidate division KSB1 bacterium]MDZ7358496.1 poly-gamma-glutamate biosynthesis protein PgsC [candidate division KSB1 bacterium]MDZ7376334.1 poly-gamma-glutamate biosynthesis protein PgsC [candidate division KSB1 bacterium]MDZ7401476.1 poly-gamma-glutamate biosynthesis protein PgsC [candidate division KSB1 bacterium]
MRYEISFLGLLISLLFISLTGYYPGGIIVPSYLVLFVDQPARIAATWVVALLTMISFKIISRHLILFGKRRLVFMILFGGLWTFISLQFFPSILPASLEFRVIGWVVPGLIANQFERQGVLITTAALITVTVTIYFLGKLLF